MRLSVHSDDVGEERGGLGDGELEPKLGGRSCDHGGSRGRVGELLRAHGDELGDVLAVHEREEPVEAALLQLGAESDEA